MLLKALKAGRRVKLPNGTIFRPVGKKDGSISVKVRFSPCMLKAIASEQRANWVNADNVNWTEAEMIALWSELHPDDPVEE